MTDQNFSIPSFPILEFFKDKLAGVPLVDPRQFMMARTVFVTISPNPKVKHPVIRTIKTPGGKRKEVTMMLPYEKLPQKVQYDYCIRRLRKDYIEFLPDCSVLGTWELNKQGNVHIHFLLSHDNFNNPKYIHVFRRDVLNCLEVMRNISKKADKDYMNNIVMLDRPAKDVMEYMDKEYYENDIFDNYKYNLK